MARHTLPRTSGGYGLDAQWSDDFHHVLHVLLTGEQAGYYTDFKGLAQLAKVWREGFAFTGEYSRYRRHKRGSSPRRNKVKQFVVCSQNHDQIGNRMLGDRLSTSLSFEQQKLAAGAVLLSPFVPLLFMGEEYGETAPFQYFVSHSDSALVEAVRKGRREEFAAFAWQDELPDPQAEATFQRCKLNHALATQSPHETLRAFYQELLRLRKELPAIADVEKKTMETTPFEKETVFMARQWWAGDEIVLVFNFSGKARSLELAIPPGKWRNRLDSAGSLWSGPRQPDLTPVTSTGLLRLELLPTSFVLYQKIQDL